MVDEDRIRARFAVSTAGTWTKVLAAAGGEIHKSNFPTENLPEGGKFAVVESSPETG
jgi:hypothetical protein